ncbi:MAG: hypothetical protein IPH03_12050 [Tetrasphaera sp.]|nr:hypothetical protein [Tetrasphaera sp.]
MLVLPAFVGAGMRQLAATGWIHWRVRMVGDEAATTSSRSSTSGGRQAPGTSWRCWPTVISLSSSYGWLSDFGGTGTDAALLPESSWPGRAKAAVPTRTVPMRVPLGPRARPRARRGLPTF